jgi:hypothetical protein
MTLGNGGDEVEPELGPRLAEAYERAARAFEHSATLAESHAQRHGLAGKSDAAEDEYLTADRARKAAQRAREAAGHAREAARRDRRATQPEPEPEDDRMT